jgi:hypothetical protein
MRELIFAELNEIGTSYHCNSPKVVHSLPSPQYRCNGEIKPSSNFHDEYENTKGYFSHDKPVLFQLSEESSFSECS